MILLPNGENFSRSVGVFFVYRGFDFEGVVPCVKASVGGAFCMLLNHLRVT